MIWQLAALVSAIFLCGAVYGAYLHRLIARALFGRSTRESALPVTWKWVGDRTSLRLPTRSECGAVPADDTGLRTLCSELYGR